MPLAIGVSGGADSMALLRLAAEWAKAHRVGITSLTVDHGLRKESAGEAVQVAQWCVALGVEHVTLHWRPETLPMTNIQASARRARYDLMGEWCTAHGAGALLVAHHLDDQVETMIERLLRGSGAWGMAGMSAARELRPGVVLLRPLLSFPRSALIEYLRANNQPWIDDPSNADIHYTRVKIRNYLKNNYKLYELVNSLGHMREYLSRRHHYFLTQHVRLHEEGYMSASWSVLASASRETACFVLGWMCQTISGSDYAPRQKELEGLYHQLVVKNKKSASLQGCLWQRSGKKGEEDVLLAVREPARLSPALPVTRSQETLWDRRFALIVPEHAEYRGTEIRALGSEGKALLEAAGTLKNCRLNARILSTLPALWHLERLLCVPHMGYYAKPALPRLSVRTLFAESLARVPFVGMLGLYGEETDAEYGT